MTSKDNDVKNKINRCNSSPFVVGAALLSLLICVITFVIAFIGIWTNLSSNTIVILYDISQWSFVGSVILGMLGIYFSTKCD